jgi:hypothetical protein
MKPERFLTFACTGQSGHTILAAILDAHPNSMVSEELKVMRKMAKGRWATPEEMFERVMKDSRDRVKGTRSYRRRIGTIEGQGTYEDKLLLLGDKCGWDAIGNYTERGEVPRTLLSFEESIGIPLYVIHALRNPYDLISNWVMGGKGTLDNQIERFADTAYATQRIYYDSEFPKHRIMPIKNEALCANPSAVILDMCIFLELEPKQEFIKKCEKIIFSKPHVRKNEVKWDKKSINRVAELIDHYAFLREYSFETV